MDDAFLMRVLDRCARQDEQFQAFVQRQAQFIAVLREGCGRAHNSITKYGWAAGGGAGVVNPRDVGVVHQRQRLALGFKARDDLR